MKRTISFLCAIAMLTAMFVSAIPTASAADTLMGYVEYTKIVAYIDDRPIRSYNINNNTYIIAEDLTAFGFQVSWDGATGTLSIGDRTGGITSTYKIDPTAPTSGKAMPYYYSQVKTVILPNHQITSYNIGGASCINMDDLAKYYATDYFYDGVKGELRMTVNSCKHQYTTTAVAATCVSDGGTRYSCTLCGHSYLDSTGKASHNLDFNTYICSTCGGSFQPTLTMTAAEKNTANSVYYISQRQIWHQDEHNRYVLVFSLRDRNERDLTVPAIVKIKIKNNNGEIVYSSIRTLTSNDYSTWWYNNGSTRKWQATVYINDSDIAKGSTDTGSIYFEVINPEYFDFGESVLSISNLPKINISELCSLNLPSLPATTGSAGYDGSVNITNINYTFKESYNGKVDLTIAFSGRKNDSIVSKGKSSMRIAWYLYDEHGNSVRGDSFYITSIAPGETFYHDRSIVYNLTPGKYTLKFEELPSEQCSLSLPSVPHTINYYDSKNVISETIRVTDIQYEFTSGYDGNTRLYMYFSGTKLYDKRGSGQSNAAKIGWKLYDIYGSVVESGTVYTAGLAMGETFRNEDATAYDLAPGKYRLEILNVN